MPFDVDLLEKLSTVKKARKEFDELFQGSTDEDVKKQELRIKFGEKTVVLREVTRPIRHAIDKTFEQLEGKLEEEIKSPERTSPLPPPPPKPTPKAPPASDAPHAKGEGHQKNNKT